MTARRLAAVDARTFWLSSAIPDDQFLLYAFDGPIADLDAVLADLRRRAATCADLGVRISDTEFWSYPRWAPRPVGRDHVAVHSGASRSWDDCLRSVVTMSERQLDAGELTWQLHVFPDVEGVPGSRASAAVVVLQICHALADGIRAAELAAHLLGRTGAVAPVPADARAVQAFPVRAVRAGRAHQRLMRDTAAGLVPPQAPSVPPLRSNTRPDGTRHLRVLVCERSRFGASTVTVGALAAISAALAGHLRELGDDPQRLGAEVPMATTGPRLANNHFGNVAVGLHPAAPLAQRTAAIAAELARRRRRAAHPAMMAEARALASVPAPLLRWGVGTFDPDVRSAAVTGNTVVSSVNRGPADLTLGGAPVLLTAGYSTLSPMMGVFHGVHGIGDTVAVSVHAAESSIGDVDSYVDRLSWKLGARPGDGRR